MGANRRPSKKSVRSWGSRESESVSYRISPWRNCVRRFNSQQNTPQNFLPFSISRKARPRLIARRPRTTNEQDTNEHARQNPVSKRLDRKRDPRFRAGGARAERFQN